MLTRQREKYKPVNDQNWPEDRQIEDLKPAAHEADHYCPRCRVPKLELR